MRRELMLVLSRKPGESLFIGSDIVITLVEVMGNRVKIGINAPADIEILRGELRAAAGAVGAGRASSRSEAKDLVPSA
jgi:carbon storage regulator